MLALFVTALFISSALMFVIEPMFAKMVLPKFGGTPVVWNTCMVFFQAALLAGYAYAHFLTRHFSLRKQAFIHVLVLLTPLAVLPVVVSARWLPAADSNPFFVLFGLLLFTVGLPFFVISTSGPLLQRWFSTTGHRHASDPYFLYAASNLGSMIGLLAYPVLLEPWLTIRQQSQLWAAGYLILVLVTLVCAIAAMVGAKRFAAIPSPVGSTVPDLPFSAEVMSGGSASDRAGTQRQSLGWKRRLRWILLAAAPSSMMLGLTLHITTDIAAVPFLWVIPLAVYLLSFIVVFSRRPLIPHAWALRVLPMLILVTVLLMAVHAGQPMWLVFPLHILTFFFAALVCHGELAAGRPEPAYLTEFYLLLSVGGVIGGIFNALAAPLLFNSVAEYPIAIVLVCLLRPSMNLTADPAAPSKRVARVLDLVWPAALMILALGLIAACDKLQLEAGPARSLIVAGIPAAICFVFKDRPLRYGLGIAAILLAGAINCSELGDLIIARRSFFGVHSVRRLSVTQAAAASPADSAPAGQNSATTFQYNVIVHGNIMHGMQRVDPASGRPDQPQEALLYFHAQGPIGEVMQTILNRTVQSGRENEDSRPPASTAAVQKPGAQVAIIGMGAGALAAYARPADHFTYYEIDPVVEDLAVRSGYFTHVPEARRRGAIVDVVLGDARLTLENAADHSFDILVLDAFSSDSIPLHLLTREALQLYRKKLAPGGVLAWHISNRFLRLEPVVAASAAEVGWACWICDDTQTCNWRKDNSQGRAASVWVVLAEDETHLAPLPQNPRWKRLTPPPQQAVWTDDFTNILSVFKWSGQEGP